MVKSKIAKKIKKSSTSWRDKDIISLKAKVAKLKGTIRPPDAHGVSAINPALLKRDAESLKLIHNARMRQMTKHNKNIQSNMKLQHKLAKDRARLEVLKAREISKIKILHAHKMMLIRKQKALDLAKIRTQKPLPKPKKPKQFVSRTKRRTAKEVFGTKRIKRRPKRE